MKSATVYNYKNYLLFVVNHKFSDGLVRMTAEIQLLDISDSANALTSALKLCFERFNNGLDYRSEMNKAFQSRISEAVGVKKYKDFLKDSNMIKLVDFGDEVKLQPLKSTSKFKGYESYQGVIESYSREDLENHKLIQGVLRLFEEMKRNVNQS